MTTSAVASRDAETEGLQPDLWHLNAKFRGRRSNKDDVGLSGKGNQATASSAVSLLECPMREAPVRIYQHVIKFSHVSPGFHHHCFWVYTSFSGWAGAQ